MSEQWMVISWKHVDHLDAAYGKLLETVNGSGDEAAEAAKAWVEHYAPIGIVRIIA